MRSTTENSSVARGKFDTPITEIDVLDLTIEQHLEHEVLMMKIESSKLLSSIAATVLLTSLAGPTSAMPEKEEAMSQNTNTTIQEGEINTNDTFQVGDSNDNATYQQGLDNANRTRQRGTYNWNETGQFGRVNFNTTDQSWKTDRKVRRKRNRSKN